MKNRLIMFFSAFALLITIITIIFYILVEIVFTLSTRARFYLSILFGVMAFADVGMLFTSVFMIKQKREKITKALDHYIENEISRAGMGAIIFDEDLFIIWASEFVYERLGSIIGKKISNISPEFKSNYESGNELFKIEHSGLVLDVMINLEKSYLLLKDVTNEDTVLSQYVSEKTVIAELEIDNFSEFQATLSEEQLFQIRTAVIKMLDTLVENNNLIYRQYVNGKFLIFTNQETLEDLITSDFNFLDDIRSVKLSGGINLTASMGIGTGTSTNKIVAELAREGLTQAQARGGDQVALVYNKEKPKYFGSKFERARTISRVKIKQTAELLEAKLKDPGIKNVIIYGHEFADLDAVGASLGFVSIATAFNKPSFIQNVTFDGTTTEAMASILTKEEKQLFIKPSKANRETTKNTLIIITDTAELNRIENDRALKNSKSDNVFVFDHHRVSQLPEDISSTNVYIDTTASSANEIVSEVIHFLKRKIKLSKSVAQMMLNGIYLDTQNFTKSTSSRTYMAASYLENQGAQSSLSSDILKLTEDQSAIINKILINIEEIKPGFFLSVYEGEVPGDIISKATDEILRTKGRKAAFVIGKIPGQQIFKMSARGIETNVQKIAESVGGGGHFGAAAAVSKESLPVFTDNIRQAIVSDKGVK